MTIENVLGVLAGLALLATVLSFWFWMMRDCLSNEPSVNSKIVWMLIIVLGNWLGALLYFLLRRSRRKELIGQ